MKGIHCFVVKPKGKRYNNEISIKDKKLIVNTENYNHEFVNREAVVVSCPMSGSLGIKPGDTVIVHHNVFRRWQNIRGEEKNSSSYIDEDNYIVYADQIFLYKSRNNKWKATKGYCFIKPIKNTNKFNESNEKPCMGIVKYTDGSFDKEDLVGFKPNSDYEFVFEGERLYRVFSHFITIKYEYQGNEEEYNPSWA